MRRSIGVIAEREPFEVVANRAPAPQQRELAALELTKCIVAPLLVAPFAAAAVSHAVASLSHLAGVAGLIETATTVWDNVFLRGRLARRHG